MTETLLRDLDFAIFVAVGVLICAIIVMALEAFSD